MPIERRDFISWMDSAKEPEPHRRRIEEACALHAAGKRRPVMDFYFSAPKSKTRESRIEKSMQ